MNFFKYLLLSFFLSLSFTSIAEDGPLELVQKTSAVAVVLTIGYWFLFLLSKNRSLTN